MELFELLEEVEDEIEGETFEELELAQLVMCVKGLEALGGLKH